MKEWTRLVELADRHIQRHDAQEGLECQFRDPIPCKVSLKLERDTERATWNIHGSHCVERLEYGRCGISRDVLVGRPENMIHQLAEEQAIKQNIKPPRTFLFNEYNANSRRSIMAGITCQ